LHRIGNRDLAFGQFLPARWVDVITKHIETLFGQAGRHIRPHLAHAENGNSFLHSRSPPNFSRTGRASGNWPRPASKPSFCRACCQTKKPAPEGTGFAAKEDKT